MTDSQIRKREMIIQIQDYLSQGYSQTKICRLMKTIPRTVRKYGTGDPDILCLGNYGSRISILDEFCSQIIELLSQQMSFKDILQAIQASGYTGKRTALGDYFHKLITQYDLTHKKSLNVIGVPINTQIKLKSHYLNRTDIFKHLWSGKGLEQADWEYICRKYRKIEDFKQCIIDFRNIFTEKQTKMMSDFIRKYSEPSNNKHIVSFANGLKKDITAVENSITMPYSNGFVEGNNNRLKLIKRAMYGRAKLKLLGAKIIYGHIFLAVNTDN
jgi:hypothetical protein